MAPLWGQASKGPSHAVAMASRPPPPQGTGVLFHSNAGTPLVSTVRGAVQSPRSVSQNRRSHRECATLLGGELRGSVVLPRGTFRGRRRARATPGEAPGVGGPQDTRDEGRANTRDAGQMAGLPLVEPSDAAPSASGSGQAPCDAWDVVVERQPDGSSKRFTLTEVVGTAGALEEPRPSGGSSPASAASGNSERVNSKAPFLRSIRTFFLPAGFPGSVSSDYLRYMLWTFPTHVTGWTTSTLVTSTLLQAVGVGQAPQVGPTAAAASAVAATAAIKWVTKDGIGALGTLLVGGRFGAIFDEDPKQWRMYADIVGSAGSVFELATPLAPSYFLLLASLGHLTKAVAKGLKDPSSRVIQNHLAVRRNLGDVAAKDEVWRVGAQMLGLGAGVLLLSSPEVASSYWTLVATWLLLRTAHLGLRFRSLSVLAMNTLNFKRAALLARAHVAGEALPRVEAANAREILLVPRRKTRPLITFGCSFEDALGRLEEAAPGRGLALLRGLLLCHSREAHILIPLPGSASAFLALFKDGADNWAMLRCIWQAEWILHHEVILHQDRTVHHERTLGVFEASTPDASPKGLGGEGCGGSPGVMKSEDYRFFSRILESQCEGTNTSHGGPNSDEAFLCFQARSVRALELGFQSFLQGIQENGWDVESPVIKFPANAPLLSREDS